MEPAVVVDFLKDCTGFQMLPDQVLRRLSTKLSLEYFPAGTPLFVEGQSRIENIILIEVGTLQLSSESATVHNLEKLVLERGDVFGAISVLLNNSLSIRSVHTLTDCFLY